MGIDKSDVRLVHNVYFMLTILTFPDRYIIHYDLPKSFEGEKHPEALRMAV